MQPEKRIIFHVVIKWDECAATSKCPGSVGELEGIFMLF